MQGVIGSPISTIEHVHTIGSIVPLELNDLEKSCRSAAVNSSYGQDKRSKSDSEERSRSRHSDKSKNTILSRLIKQKDAIKLLD